MHVHRKEFIPKVHYKMVPEGLKFQPFHSLPQTSLHASFVLICASHAIMHATPMQMASVVPRDHFKSGGYGPAS